MSQYPTEAVDLGPYADRIARPPGMASASPVRSSTVVNSSGERIVYRDDVCVVFVPAPQRLYGYMLLAPIEHRTRVIDDFEEEHYSSYSGRVHRLGRALGQPVPTEGLYVFSFGSNQGVTHSHWHLAPLPPGVPFEEQQFAAVTRAEHLVTPAHEQAVLAESINQAMRT